MTRRLLLVLLTLAPATALAQSEPYKVFDTKPVITRGPYLVATGTTTATVVWLTDTPSHSLVRYARGSDLPPRRSRPSSSRSVMAWCRSASGTSSI